MGSAVGLATLVLLSFMTVCLLLVLNLVYYEYLDCEGVLIYGEHLDGFSQDIHAVVSHGSVTCLCDVHTRPSGSY